MRKLNENFLLKYVYKFVLKKTNLLIHNLRMYIKLYISYHVFAEHHIFKEIAD